MRRRLTARVRYRDQGELATIGRSSAVLLFGRVKIRGPAAWWFWLTAHVFFLIGFRNRVVVLIDWAWAYWTYQRSARIIVGLDDPGAGAGSNSSSSPSPSPSPSPAPGPLRK